MDDLPIFEKKQDHELKIQINKASKSIPYEICKIDEGNLVGIEELGSKENVRQYTVTSISAPYSHIFFIPKNLLNQTILYFKVKNIYILILKYFGIL